jgi:hypothetical protein
MRLCDTPPAAASSSGNNPFSNYSNFTNYTAFSVDGYGDFEGNVNTSNYTGA